MKTLIFIEGGMSFSTYDAYLSWLQSEYIESSSVPYSIEPKKKWKQKLAREWIEKWGVAYMPEMPCDLDAKYNEWKIVFEWVLSKIAPDDELTFVGHSLGGNFLLKYFSEISVISTIGDILLGERGQDFSQNSKWRMPRIHQIHLVAACVSEGDFTAPENYDILKNLWNRVHIWHAEDDALVPFTTAKFLEKSLPEAEKHFFDPERGYGHFFPLAVFGELEEVVFSQKKTPQS